MDDNNVLAQVFYAASKVIVIEKKALIFGMPTIWLALFVFILCCVLYHLIYSQ